MSFRQQLHNHEALAGINSSLTCLHELCAWGIAHCLLRLGRTCSTSRISRLVGKTLLPFSRLDDCSLCVYASQARLMMLLRIPAHSRSWSDRPDARCVSTRPHRILTSSARRTRRRDCRNCASALFLLAMQENGTMTQHVYGSGPCVTMLGYDTVQAWASHNRKKCERLVHVRWVRNSSHNSSLFGSDLANLSQS